MAKQEPVSRTEIRKHLKAQGCQVFMGQAKSGVEGPWSAAWGREERTRTLEKTLLEISSRGWKLIAHGLSPPKRHFDLCCFIFWPGGC